MPGTGAVIIPGATFPADGGACGVGEGTIDGDGMVTAWGSGRAPPEYAGVWLKGAPGVMY
jgi:hypothetical protein